MKHYTRFENHQNITYDKALNDINKVCQLLSLYLGNFVFCNLTLLLSEQFMAKMASICNPFTPILEDHVRFVCISDTHMQLEKRPHHFIPIGDVLLHSGDFTNLGLPREIDAFNNYMG